MDRPTLLESLARRLKEAAACRDWKRIRVIDREIAAALPPARSRGPALSPREKAAYVELRRVHAEVRAHCKREADLYAVRLAGMREMKIAWSAYAEQESFGRGVR